MMTSPAGTPAIADRSSQAAGFARLKGRPPHVGPGAVDDQHHRGPQGGDPELGEDQGEGGHRGFGHPVAGGGPRAESVRQRLGQLRIANHADQDRRRRDRQRGDQPAHREPGRIGAPARVGDHRRPQAGEPALAALDGGDLPARDQQAADIGGHLDRHDGMGDHRDPCTASRTAMTVQQTPMTAVRQK
jgi:hypothetical protein